MENKFSQPTPYRISTITSTGCVGTTIDLDVLYNTLEALCVDDLESSGIVSCRALVQIIRDSPSSHMIQFLVYQILTRRLVL